MFKDDPDLVDYTLDCYTFPTSRLWVSPWKRVTSLADLARGLRTELRIRHSGRPKVILVCHSLGGLIARQYALTEVQEGRVPAVEAMLLLATPNSGATLAAAGKELFGRNLHVTALDPFSSALEGLNDDWVSEDMEHRVRVQYVAGGADMIVSQPSAKGLPGRKLDDMLIGYGHSSIVEALSRDDDNYLLIKDFILGGDRHLHTDLAIQCDAAPAADPLFEVYRASHEPYYYVRESDAFLLNAAQGGHVWLSGRSGIGKTASIQRRASLSGYKVSHVLLSSFEEPSARGLIRAICAELAESLDYDGLLPAGDELPDSIMWFRRIVRFHMASGKHAILIEEIPLPPGEEYSSFLGHVSQLVLGLEAEQADDVRLFFSSLHDPTADMPDGLSKLRARVQFIPFTAWSEGDLLGLVELLTPVLQKDLSSEERQQIASAAEGSPRFVKAVFQRWRNGTAGAMTTKELLASVRAERI